MKKDLHLQSIRLIHQLRVTHLLGIRQHHLQLIQRQQCHMCNAILRIIKEPEHRLLQTQYRLRLPQHQRAYVPQRDRDSVRNR